jgi:GcrA cell cycle regulator
MGLTKNAVIGRLHRNAMTRREIPPLVQPRRNVFELAGPSCLWPYGHPNDASFHFCGARPLPGKPYCAEHAAIAYIRPKDQKSNAA